VRAHRGDRASDFLILNGLKPVDRDPLPPLITDETFAAASVS
jgi:hypothetical protein